MVLSCRSLAGKFAPPSSLSRSAKAPAKLFYIKQDEKCVALSDFLKIEISHRTNFTMTSTSYFFRRAREASHTPSARESTPHLESPSERECQDTARSIAGT